MMIRDAPFSYWVFDPTGSLCATPVVISKNTITPVMINIGRWIDKANSNADDVKNCLGEHTASLINNQSIFFLIRTLC